MQSLVSSLQAVAKSGKIVDFLGDTSSVIVLSGMLVYSDPAAFFAEELGNRTESLKKYILLLPQTVRRENNAVQAV